MVGKKRLVRYSLILNDYYAKILFFSLFLHHLLFLPFSFAPYFYLCLSFSLSFSIPLSLSRCYFSGIILFLSVIALYTSLNLCLSFYVNISISNILSLSTLLP